MGLSCDCDYDYDSDWYYFIPKWFTCSINHQKCCSCKKDILAGTELLEFEIEGYNEITDELINLSSKYMCEKCGEIFLNLDALDYCIMLGDNMHELLKEYQKITKFKESGYG
jgi:hypothetical protein